MDLLNELHFKEETYQIIGVAYEVHNEKSWAPNQFWGKKSTVQTNG